MPLPAADRPARPQLEVLGRGRRRARALGRLPEGVLGDAVAHEHGVGAVVRDPGRPQMVRADRRGGRARAHADGHRPALPAVSKRQREALLEVKRALEAQAPEGAAPDPFEHSSGRRESQPTGGTGSAARRRRSAAFRVRRGRHPTRGGERWRRQRHRAVDHADAGNAWYRVPADEVADPARRRPGRRALELEQAAELLERQRAERAAGGAGDPGLAAVPRAVPQLHADHPGRRPRSCRW